MAIISVSNCACLLFSGYVSDAMDEVDDQNVEFKPVVVVRTLQPWHTKISRLAHLNVQ